MKNFLGVILILLIPIFGNAQQQTSELQTPEHYLKKSKVQKVFGTVVLSTGIASTILGTAMIIDDNQDKDEFLEGLGREVGTGFIVVGILAAGSSYFLYKGSKKNRAKYESLRPTVGILKNPATQHSTPAVGFALNF